jgi:hypothetical protein
MLATLTRYLTKRLISESVESIGAFSAFLHLETTGPDRELTSRKAPKISDVLATERDFVPGAVVLGCVSPMSLGTLGTFVIKRLACVGLNASILASAVGTAWRPFLSPPRH